MVLASAPREINIFPSKNPILTAFITKCYVTGKLYFMPIERTWPSTTKVIAQRMVEGSEPGNRTDPYRLACIGSPGGESGAVYVAAGLDYIKETGQRVRPGYNGIKVFDVFKGPSSFAIVEAFGAASILEEPEKEGQKGKKKGQIELGQDIFNIHLRDPRFYDKSRLLKGALGKGRPAMDVEYLIYEIMKNPSKSPLNIENIQALKGLVVVDVYVTSAATGLATKYDLTQLTEEQIRLLLWASAKFPFVAGPDLVKLWDDTENTDGGVGTYGAPAQQTINENAILERNRITHAIVQNKESPLTKKLWSWLNELGAQLWSEHSALVNALRELVHNSNINNQFLKEVEDPLNRIPEEGKLHMQVVAPPLYGPGMPLATKNGVKEEIKKLGREAMRAKLKPSLYALTGKVYA